MQYFDYRNNVESDFKVSRNTVTGTKCRTGQLNHQFVEQVFTGGVWVNIGDPSTPRYDTVAGEGCRFREGQRIGDYVVDVELEVAGFLLAENDGWENIGGAVAFKPKNLIVVTISDTRIDLVWEGGGIAIIERSIDGVNYNQIATSSLSYSDTGLTPNTLYYYRVMGGVYSNIDSDTTLVIPVLDSYAGATGAYGLRKLRTAYAGNCILVRRSSDDTELAIGFLNGVLDDTALLTFCGAGDGFVKTWYDQSGNANNATQATAATQPKIVSAGAFIIEDGLRVIKFSGAQGLEANGVVSAINGTDLPLSVFSAISTGILTAGGSIPWSFGLSTSIVPFYFMYDSQTANNIGGYSKRDNAGSIKSGGFILLNSKANLYTLVDKGTTLSIYSNGSAVINTGVPVVDVDSNIGTITCDTFSIGYLRRTTTSAYFKGGVNEIIVYGEDKTADKVAIEDNMNNSLGNPFYV